MRRQQYSTVVVKQECATSKSNVAPSSPTPGSPKKVAFAPCVKAVSRPLNGTEAWSMYHFEAHAQQCPDCYDPREGQRLCFTGHGLARDIAQHVCCQDGVVYSKKKDNHKLVQVDLPRNYTQVARLLKSMERALKTTHRTSPIISYDRASPVSAQRTIKMVDDGEENQTGVIIEPARTDSKRNSKSKHKSARYGTVGVDIVVDVSARQPEPARKEEGGSTYYKDEQRDGRGGYRMEIRQPERRGRRRE